MDRLVVDSSLLFVVDVQERLADAMPKESLEKLIKNTRLLLQTSNLLGVPVLASEQYPKGLGPTIAPILELLAQRGIAPIDKLDFDAASEPRISSQIGRFAPRSIVLVGIETHICVFQTARELVRRGHVVHVVSDAVTSRTEDNHAAGLRLSERAGAVITVAEAVAFDWVGRAGTDTFRAVSRLVR
jgi:nicotinamidase-related amidase